MPSTSNNQGPQAPGTASSTQHHDDQSYALQEYLRAKPTITEQISGVVWAGKGGNGKEKLREDKAKDALKGFDSAWRDASK
ncbi:hypothetical protein F4818DRAFT_439341 [Hypoxylon cercidicola]|nr:hypothetical protein F4818DRAFT_439341 [Hypoxylon cercidicola]